MATKNAEAYAAVSKTYEWGFSSDIEQDFAPKGLSEDTVRYISAKKGEPQWMLDWRLKAYARWLEMETPDWSKLNIDPIDYQDAYYYAEPKAKPKLGSLDEDGGRGGGLLRRRRGGELSHRRGTVGEGAAAAAHGESWLTRAPTGAGNVRAGIEWLLPYVAGEKTHQEFVRSTVRFDAERAAAGVAGDRKSTRLDSSHMSESRMPSSA